MTKLSDAEWKIISFLWNNPPMTLMEITKALENETGWSKSTVITLLKRMEEKEAISHEEKGRTKYFYPILEKNQVNLEETKSFLDKVYSGRVGLMISNMIKQEALTEEEIEELYAILKGDK
ncbi:MAG: BlaI/MecI/CopY family transcriptional regulator [Lachnospiraceae bacterium]|nr:BlaI/MecI/CopY family transcriptional regulator [Lachnospiraceae bacterium]